jgi:hypothetical protein
MYVVSYMMHVVLVEWSFEQRGCSIWKLSKFCYCWFWPYRSIRLLPPVQPVPFQPGPMSVNLEVWQVPFTTYTYFTSWWWAVDAPEACRSVITQYTEDKQCIVLVIHTMSLFSKLHCNYVSTTLTSIPVVIMFVPFNFRYMIYHNTRQSPK